MKQFKTIFRFELLGYLKNKVFVGVTLVLVAVIAAITFSPRLAAIADVDVSDIPDDIERPVMLLKADTDDALAAFSEAFYDYEVVASDDDLDAIKRQVIEGEAECAFVLTGPTSYTYYVNNLSLYDSNTMLADELLQNLYRIRSVVESGVDPAKAQDIFEAQIEGSVESLGVDQAQNFFYTYIMVVALYFVILMYGQMVATNVAAEKSSRAMEVLVTSAHPTAMMFGKVLASCTAGFIQLVCIFGTAVLSFNLNKSYFGDNIIINSLFDIPLDILLYMLLFFILGFFLYAFMYGAVASTVSKLEDINTSIMPITMLFIVAFFVVIFSMNSGSIDNIMVTVCSYIPFTSPMAMFARIAMSNVSPVEIIISVAILIGSTVGIGIISAKIYRVGVLLYGTKPKLGDLLKSVWRA